MHCKCPLSAQSGHISDTAKCPLMTQQRRQAPHAHRLTGARISPADRAVARRARRPSLCRPAPIRCGPDAPRRRCCGGPPCHASTAHPCPTDASARCRDLVDQFIDILPPHQLALLLHQAQLQHFGLDLDMIGVGLRSRRPPMFRAQVLDVAQPRCGLVVTAIAALLDHRFSRQPRDVLPCAAQMCRQIWRSRRRRPPCGPCRASVRTFMRHHFGHRSILKWETVAHLQPSAAALQQQITRGRIC